MSFDVDPDALTAASRVARRQDRHLGTIKSYVEGACSDFGAFSGVLNLFEASYRSAVSTAKEGLEDSRAVATKVSDALVDSRDDYLDTDREVYDWFRSKFGDVVDFPPYSPPGSGSSDPDGPHQDAPSGERPDAPEGSRPGLPSAPWWVDKPLGQAFPTPKGDEPGWLDPKDAAKDWVKDQWRRHVVDDEYDYYRRLGYSDSEALELARADRPNATTQADTRNYEAMQERARDAYEQGYRDARDNGATPAEARDAAREAGNRQFGEDSADRTRRTDIRDGVGTVRGLYDETGRLINNVNDLGENIEDIRDTNRDRDRYDDYESGDEDESAQEWAGR